MNNIMFAKYVLAYNVRSWKIDQYYELVSSSGSPNVLPSVNRLAVQPLRIWLNFLTAYAKLTGI